MASGEEMGRRRRRRRGEEEPRTLIRQHPNILRREVEQTRRHRGLVHGHLVRRGQLGEVVHQAESHGTPGGAAVMCGGIHQVLSFVRGSGEVLQRDPAVPGLSKRTGRCPPVGGRQVARCLGRGCRGQGEAQAGEVRDRGLHVAGNNHHVWKPRALEMRWRI
jgi:hypothetical protein